MIPLISVIVPVYNAEKYIERCIESILRQTFENYELIIVDDGSTDASEDICRRYARKDNRISIVNQKNSGPDIARKAGVGVSKGKYLLFVDADDYISDTALDTMYAVVEKENADLVCSQIQRFDNKGRVWTDKYICIKQRCISDTKSAMQAYFADKELQGTYYAKLIRRELLIEYHFVENSVIGEDITAALYMYRKAEKIIMIPDICYHYYWNGNSISHSGYTDRHYVSLLNYIRLRDELLVDKYVSDDIICGYFAGFEMAVATAMSRNKHFDETAACVLRKDLRKYWHQIKEDSNTKLYMKMCIGIYLVSPKLFCSMFRIVYRITGR